MYYHNYISAATVGEGEGEGEEREGGGGGGGVKCNASISCHTGIAYNVHLTLWR